MDNKALLAAVDLGSNSFRLEIGRFEHGQLQRVDYLKETVRLGNGFDDERNLSAAAMERGWACLARFAERLAGFGADQVRAVATQTLREARNRDVFIQRGQELLGFPIEIIAGTEEARLIYQGAAHLLPHSSERRLVIDIGGRSTELVLGCGSQTLQAASYQVGSVAWSMKYFPKGEFTEPALHRAEIAAQAVFDEALSDYSPAQWDRAYGASGTVGAVADVLLLAGWPADQVSSRGLDWLVQHVRRAGNTTQVQLNGLKDDRRAVLGGGISVLRALMNLLQIETLHVACGALRHGVLLEMVERQAHAPDVRDNSVQRLAQKFALDGQQSSRVGRVAERLLAQMLPASAGEFDNLQRKLRWACALHEIGTAVSHSGYHKHGAYILQNADMMGFSLPELQRLSLLVLGHRGKVSKLEQHLNNVDFVMQLLALRLAVILCHARQEPQDHNLHLSCNPRQQRFTLSLDTAWLEAFPQSSHLLHQESLVWQKTAWSFELLLQ